jgi:transposase
VRTINENHRDNPHESVYTENHQKQIGLLNLAEELGNVSKACQMMGVSRDTFYRYQSARDEGGVDALLDKSKRQPNPKNRVEHFIEQAVLKFVLDYPAHGRVRVSNELRKQGTFVSPSGVRSIWLRHTLQSRRLRLKALEKKVVEEGIVLTEAQVFALEPYRPIWVPGSTAITMSGAIKVRCAAEELPCKRCTMDGSCGKQRSAD